MITERTYERPAEISFRLPHLYRAEDWAEVNRFLQRSGDVYSLLTAAAPQILHCFGGTAEASLDVVHDPECGGVPELLVRIETGEDWQTASTRLDRFDEAWWLEARANTESLVTLDIAVH